MITVDDMIEAATFANPGESIKVTAHEMNTLFRWTAERDYTRSQYFTFFGGKLEFGGVPVEVNQ